jgi:hypothetical protein
MQMRSKYFNFRTEEHDKLNRLLQYTYGIHIFREFDS